MCVNMNQMLHSNVIQPKTDVHSLMCCPPICRPCSSTGVFVQKKNDFVTNNRKQNLARWSLYYKILYNFNIKCVEARLTQNKHLIRN